MILALDSKVPLLEFFGGHGALLKKQIGGFRRWNLDELRLVKRKKRASR
jgi:hypothetical protein